MRLSLAIAFAALLWLAPSAALAEGEGIGIDMSGTTVDLGQVTPGQPHHFAYSTHLTVHSASPYSLLADAPADFTTSGPPVQAMPIDRLEWRIHGTGIFTAFLAGLQVIRGAQPPSPPEGATTVLDYRLVPTFADLPTSSDGSDPYRAGLTFTVTAGTIDSAYAWPNPFSPDGDGVDDRTTIHWYQDSPRVVDVLIFDSAGTTVVRTLTESRSLDAGAQSIVWDGRDDLDHLALEDDYQFRVRVSPSEAVDPDLTLASGLIGVESGVGSGTAIVTGRVTSSQDGTPVAAATVELRRAGGNLAGTEDTNAAGVYSHTGVGAGTYYLYVTSPLHFPYTSQKFEVLDGETVTVDVTLVHNHSLTIIKVADSSDVEPGDLVGYHVEVTASGVERVTDIMVYDDLPRGLRYVPGTLHIDGHPAVVGDDNKSRLDAGLGRQLRIPVGALEAGQKVELYYEALVVVGTPMGPLTNSARATGIAAGVAVAAGPTQARVFVHDGDMGDRSLLFGQVYLDQDGDGELGGGDEPIPHARIVLDDGLIITPDTKGRYSVRGIRAGARAVMVVIDINRGAKSLALVPPGPSRVALVDIEYGVAKRLDFPIRKQWIDDYPGTTTGSKTTIALADLTVGLEAGPLDVLKVAGRLAGFVEWDLGKGYRLTGWLDTQHDPRDEMRIGQDAQFFQPELGDDSRVRPSVPDKLGLRLTTPWGMVLLGRSGTGFTKTDLVNRTRGFLGLEAQYNGKKLSARAFAGVADTLLKQDVIANDGSTGPFVLSERPVVPSSERVLVQGVGPSGDVTSRVLLQRDQEYTVDYATGQLFLTQPWATETPGAETFSFVVHYEYAPAAEFPVAPLAGARVDWTITDEIAAGATFLVEDEEPSTLVVAGVDGSLQLDTVGVRAEAAVSNRGGAVPEELAGDDPSALRLQASYQPIRDVSLFSYVNRIGGAYRPRVDFQATMPSEQGFGYLPPPQQTILRPAFLRGLFNNSRDFPFVLQSQPDRFEWGTGAQYRPRKDVALSVGTFDVANDVGDRADVARTTNHTDYVTANYTPKRWPSAFLATTGTSIGGSGSSERAFLGGSQWITDDWSVGAELRHFNRGGGAGDAPDVSGNSALLRGMFIRYRKLKPGALVQAARDDDDDGKLVARSRMVALGAESQWRSLTLFAYGSYHTSFDGTGSSGITTDAIGAFGGANFALRRVVGTARVDVSDSTQYGTRLGLGTRLRLTLTESTFAFGDLLYTSGSAQDPLAQWNHTVGLAYRPLRRPAFYLFLKYRDKSLPVGLESVVDRRRTQLGTADFVLPVRQRGLLGTRTAWKRTLSAYGYVYTAVAAEQLTWTLAGRYDVIIGARTSMSSLGGETRLGTTAAVGLRFPRGLRLVFGYNHAAADWVFEADESIPGVFINVTGVYGSAGAAAVLPYE